jgi:hypothetical protein
MLALNMADHFNADFCKAALSGLKDGGMFLGRTCGVE